MKSLVCPCCESKVKPGTKAFSGLLINGIASLTSTLMLSEKQLVELRKIKKQSASDFKLMLEIDARIIGMKKSLEDLKQLKEKCHGKRNQAV